MRHSEQINELAAALAKAQGEFTAAERDYTAKVETRKGGSYSFNYADLAAYLDVCRKPLTENGLAVVQSPTALGNVVTVTTMLCHASGQFIESDPFPLTVAFKEPGEVATPQEIGSAVTYARRYALSAILGMASEADDDGNTASGNSATTSRAPRATLPPCPKCGKNTVMPSQFDEGGFYCNKKKDGCGHKWHPEEPATTTPLGPTTGKRMKSDEEPLTPDELKMFVEHSKEVNEATAVETLTEIYKFLDRKDGRTEAQIASCHKVLAKLKPLLTARKGVIQTAMGAT